MFAQKSLDWNHADRYRHKRDISKNAVTRGHLQTAATRKASPWETPHRPNDTTQMHRKRGHSGRQLPHVPVTTHTEHRVWWVGQKFEESAALILMERQSFLA